MKVSQSKIKTKRKCNQAFWYRYKEHLRRRRISRPLKFGRIVHEMIEAHAGGNDPFEVLDSIALTQRKLFAAEIEEYGDIVADVRCIMAEYFKYYDENDLVYIRKKGKSSEFEFAIEIRPDIILNGKIDGVARTRNKLKWMVEHKSFGKAIPNEDHRWRNIQSSCYLRVLEMLGWGNIDGTCWDYIYSKSPARPEVLKSGELSKRAITTLPSRLAESLKDLGFNPKSFPELMQQAKEGCDKYFQRIFNPTQKSVVNLQFNDLIITAQEIADDNFKPVRTIDRHCEWCDYEALCRAELQGSDVDYVKEKEFYVDQAEEEKDRAE